ncbi:MAG: transporter substrate-binding protein [Rhodopila sp.]|nr:transporter substrate-binding protein [Rhodopila sp.]
MAIVRGAGRVAAVLAIVALAFGTAPCGTARAQTREETLRAVSGSTINSLDPTLLNATRESIALGMNTYDRLVTFKRKTVDGHLVFDLAHLRGELAESFTVSPDGLVISFKLRPDATFHDGTPVTVEDVKWSLDRAVLAKSGAAPQLSTGSLTRPEQFTVVDEHTFHVTLEKADQLALGNLATPFARIINSKLAKAHATADDPWADEWLKSNEAGGGAYTVDRFVPGEQLVMKRNNTWKSGEDGKLPYFKRVIVQVVPEAATRASIVERGDADISIDLQPTDVIALEQRGKVKVVSNPQLNAFSFFAFNGKRPPFDKVKVRQAIAAALPYDGMFKAALYGRGRALFGAAWTDEPPDASFPQPMSIHTDPVLAKQLLAEAGFPNGFKTTLIFSVGNAAIAEPVAALTKEALAAIGVEVEIRKLPDSQFASVATDKTFDMMTDGSAAYLPSTDYFFRIFFQGPTRWNFGSWDNPEIATLTQQARFEPDMSVYAKLAKRMIVLAEQQVPLVMLWQPNQEAVMARNIDGFTYWFHRQIDYRDLYRQ